MPGAEAPPSYRRALYLSIASSLLVPLAGVATAPVLARALGVDGRGQLAAATAPGALMLAVATFGLPEALTYVLARKPKATAKALRFSVLVTLIVGLLWFGLVVALSSYLSGGDQTLQQLIIASTALTVPSLLVNLTRGAAMGLQQWPATAIEKLLTAFVRISATLLLFSFGYLTAYTAVVVGSAASLIGGVAYFRALRRARAHEVTGRTTQDLDASSGRFRKELILYGGRSWYGSVASMLLSRLSPLLVVPLSSAEQLGLYSVAVTISDVPLLVALAIPGAVFGVASKDRNSDLLRFISRSSFVMMILGCAVVAASLDLWIGFVFGDAFNAATPITWTLLASAAISLPGAVAGSALGAWNRPGIRSAGYAALLPISLCLILLLVPPYGAMGAALASLATNMVGSLYMTIAASRVLRAPVVSFWIPASQDALRYRNEFRKTIEAGRSRARRPKSE